MGKYLRQAPLPYRHDTPQGRFGDVWQCDCGKVLIYGLFGWLPASATWLREHDLITNDTKTVEDGNDVVQ